MSRRAAKPTSVSNEHLLNASLSSASSLMALQLFSRLFTFVLNQALFRLASPKAFGTAAIQFELLLSTILFLSREGVRNALLRAWPGKDESKKDAGGGAAMTAKTPEAIATANLTLVPLVIGIPLSTITTYLYGHFAGQDARTQPYFGLAIGIYALAAVMELLSEPLHNRAMSELRTGVRVRAEGVGIITKTTVTFLVLVYDSQILRSTGDLALLAFALGQLAYSFFVIAVYIAYFGGVPLWMRRLPNPPGGGNKNGFVTSRLANYFNMDILWLSLTMSSQSVVKHFLTEGDKFILSWLSPLQDQGGYAIAVNYGSLVARIVFQPIEETSRVFFSRVLSPSEMNDRSKSRRALEQAAGALISILSVQCSLAVILLVFGTSYMPILLHALLPAQYLPTSAPQVLTAWVWYIPVLAVNGCLEAFLSSVATPEDLNKQSRWMAAFSMLYISAALGFYSIRLGDSSLVYANIINLSARIGYCLSFSKSFFNSRAAGDLLKLRSVLPKWQLLMSCTSSWLLIRTRNHGVLVILKTSGRAGLLSSAVIAHVGLGGALALCCAGTWWITSGRYLSLPGRAKTE